jgi:hypothetical protein
VFSHPIREKVTECAPSNALEKAVLFLLASNVKKSSSPVTGLNWQRGWIEV